MEVYKGVFYVNPNNVMKFKDLSDRQKLLVKNLDPTIKKRDLVVEVTVKTGKQSWENDIPGSGNIPFPECIPVSLIRGMKEGDTLFWDYTGITLSLRANQRAANIPIIGRVVLEKALKYV